MGVFCVICHLHSEQRLWIRVSYDIKYQNVKYIVMIFQLIIFDEYNIVELVVVYILCHVVVQNAAVFRRCGFCGVH
jgi:hypothetical protein